jgi:hypothetical protein
MAIDTLDMEWTVYAAEQMPNASGPELLRAQRLFYAGAQAAISLQRRGVRATEIQQELQLWARTRIGRRQGAPA